MPAVPSTLITNGVVIPMEPPDVVLAPGWVRLRHGRIDSLGEGDPPPGRGPAPGPASGDGPGTGPVDDGGPEVVIDAGGGLVLPGLVSAHQHLLDVLLRGGVATGPTFADWLLGLYYAGMSAYTPDDCDVASLLAAVETVRAGVTTVVDNWGVDNGSDPGRVRECADASMASLARSGLRVLFARMFATRLPSAWSAVDRGYDARHLTTTLDAAFSAIDALMSAYHGTENGRIRLCPSPELPEMVEPEAFVMAMDLAAQHDTIVPMHLLASVESRDAYPAATLDGLGCLGPRLLGAHCTAASRRDIAVLAARTVKVAHCPTSNAFGGRMAPLPDLVNAGLTIGLGSDNATLNCNSDILAEARRAVLTARLAGAPADLVTPARAMRMATIEGARAVGLAGSIGSLTPGKCADLIIVDTSGPHWWPRHDWLSTLVFQGRSSDVRTVIIDGEIVMRDRVLSFLDPDGERRLCHRAQRASLTIIERAGLG